MEERGAYRYVAVTSGFPLHPKTCIILCSFIAIHCSSHCNSKLIKMNYVGPVTLAVTRRGDAGLRTLLSVQMLAGNSLDTSHLLCGKTALCLNLAE